MKRFKYVILYGKNEFKILRLKKAKSEDRMFLEIYLAFGKEPSVGAIFMTTAKDARSLADSADRSGLKCAEFADIDKAKKVLKATLCFG
jgi:hypothetical protein